MKKSILIITATLLTCIFCLSGCQLGRESQKIVLTKENIHQYITVTLEAEADNAVYASDLLSPGFQFKDIHVTGTVEGNKKYSYDNVKLDISVEVESWGPNTVFGTNDTNTLTETIILDSEGNAIIDFSRNMYDYVSQATFVSYEIESVSGWIIT